VGWVMGRGVRSPAYYRGSGERRELPQQGPGAEPRPLSHFLRILGHRTLLVARKRASNCRGGTCLSAPCLATPLLVNICRIRLLIIFIHQQAVVDRS